MQSLKRVFYLPKVKLKYYHEQILFNVEITVELNYCSYGIDYEEFYVLKNVPVFTARGRVFFNTFDKKEILIRFEGQCIDDILKLYEIKPERLLLIYQFWQKYQLNNLIAGTKRQVEVVSSFFNSRCKKQKKTADRFNQNKFYFHEDKLQKLNDMNLLIDNGYKYGDRLFYKPITPVDLDKIIDLLTFENSL